MSRTAQHREWNSGIRRRVASAALTLVVALALGAVSTHSAQGQTDQAQTYKEKVLYPFTGGDGSGPYAGLIMDAQGNLYGTTTEGGGLSGCGGTGCGRVVFKGE